MKKTLRMVMAVVLVLSLCLPVLSGGKSLAAKKGYYFTYNGVSITMGSKAKKFIKKAGEPEKKKKSKSCAYKGYDYTRQYSSFILYTSTDSATGPEFVIGITFLNGNASTKEGIHIGSTEAELKEAYGDSTPTNGVYFFNKGKTKLMMMVSGGKVTQIRYAMTK